MIKRIIATVMIGLPIAAVLTSTAASATELVVRGHGVVLGIGNPVVVGPPVYVERSPYYTSSRVWIPGHWEYPRHGQRYWVAGHYQYQ